MSDSVKPQMHGRDHRPGGSDPIPGLSNSTPWVALYDNFYGQELNTADPFVDVYFPFIKVVDPDGDTYSWQATSGAGTLGSTWTYKPQILKDGVYSFTLAWWSEASLAADRAELRYLTDLNAHWPGRNVATPYIHWYFYRDYTDYTQNYEWNQRTMILPVQGSTYGGFPCLVDTIVKMVNPDSASDFNDFIDHSLYIVRVGDIGTTDNVESNDDPGPP